jgi:putative MATE family efflux protein
VKSANLTLRNKFLKYVSLNILGMLGLSCYILADTVFIARGVGSNGLTALNLALPAYSFVYGVGRMIGIGSATRFSLSKPKDIFSLAVILDVFSAVIFVLIGIFASGFVARLLGANGETITDTAIYLKVILIFSPMFMLNNLLSSFVRNDNNPKLSMIAMITGSLSNVVLDYIFIFPFGMGMFGAALATGASPVISLIILSAHFVKKKNTFRFVKIRPSFDKIKDVCSLGVFTLISELSSGIVIIVFNMLILKLAGNIGVAAYGVVANIALVGISIFNGVGEGMQPIVSDEYGKGKVKEVGALLRYGFITALSLAIIFYGINFLFANGIVDTFNKDNSLILQKLAIKGVKTYFLGFFFLGLNVISAGFFSAIGNSKNSFLISILRGFVIIIPMAIILANVFAMDGIWFTLLVTESIVFIVSVILIVRTRKKVINL